MEGNRIADEVLVSTGIYDSVSKEPYAGYVVIKGDSILEVGRGQVPDKYRKPSIPVHDYGDATICAGFGDTHTFFTGCIIDNLGIDLTGIEDLEQLEVVVRKELSAKKGKAVFGNHLSPALAGQSQTEECLNAWSPDVPVVLFIPGHGTCAMNRKAREEYGFSPEACYAEALYKIMGIYLNDRDFVDDQLVEYMHMLNARGVTSVKEMGFDDFYGFTNVLKEFDDQKKLTLRISFMSQPVGAPANIAYGKKMREKFQSEFVRFSGYNQMTDGLILAKQGHLAEPYEGTATVCEKKIDYDTIEKEVLSADENGFRFTLHSEGDGAFRKILDIYEKCRRNEDGSLLNRHGITDLELTMPEDEARMAALHAFGEIYAQVYALDTYEGYVEAYKKVIGKRQARYLNYRSLAEHGVRLCGATDLPLLFPSIPESIYYGCANYGMDRQERINPENGLTVSEMLDAWTINSQYAMQREDILGTLEAGKRADIVIFTGDLFHTPVEDILEIEVERTLVNGQEVYKRSAS